MRGRDKAVIRPPRSKADQSGIVWGAHPIWIVFDDSDEANAAWWLQRIELAFPVRAAARLRTALFFTEARSFTPMTLRFAVIATSRNSGGSTWEEWRLRNAHMCSNRAIPWRPGEE